MLKGSSERPAETQVFLAASRINRSITANVEARILRELARHLPSWVTADHLTTLGLLAQCGAGLGYALVRRQEFPALLLADLCLVLNWLGDSLDGTVARLRGQLRPRYGFYVDHVADILGATAMMAGLGASGVVHPLVAGAMWGCFLLLAAESYLAAYTVGAFEMSQGLFGPTEVRLLLLAGNVALLRSRFAAVAGRRFLLFDLGGVIACLAMAGGLLSRVVRHTVALYRAEPL